MCDYFGENVSGNDVDGAAAQMAGNWRKWTSFYWRDQPDDADKWMIVNTTNRDATLLEKSNHAAIEKILEPYTGGDDPDVRYHSAGHWAVGWVEGFEIRVYAADGSVTRAFTEMYEIVCALADYPVLDEMDLSAREHEAACEWIAQEGGGYVSKRAPKSWAGRVFSWLWDNEQSELEDDGQGHGGAPSEESILRALAALGYLNRDGREAFRAL